MEDFLGDSCVVGPEQVPRALLSTKPPSSLILVEKADKSKQQTLERGREKRSPVHPDPGWEEFGQVLSRSGSQVPGEGTTAAEMRGLRTLKGRAWREWVTHRGPGRWQEGHVHGGLCGPVSGGREETGVKGDSKSFYRTTGMTSRADALKGCGLSLSCCSAGSLTLQSPLGCVLLPSRVSPPLRPSFSFVCQLLFTLQNAARKTLLWESLPPGSHSSPLLK